MQSSNAKIGWGLWLQWVLASSLGYGAGAGLGTAIAVSMSSSACANLWCILPGLNLTLIVVTLGLAGGLMEWLVLRRYLAIAGWWVPASGLSFPLALIIALGAGMGLSGDSLAAPILMGIVFGGLSGILPWLLLRKKVSQAFLWIPAHLLGSLVGGAMGIVAFHAMALLQLYQCPWTAAGATFGAGLGDVTGIALAWLLGKSIPES